MKNKKIRVVNYPRFLISILIIISIIFAIFKISINTLQNKSENLKETNSNNVSYQITLLGEETVYLYKNNEYSEPGYKAITNKNEDITKDVKINNNVNTSVPGKYKITYSIGDNIIKRNVIVKGSTLLKKGQKSNNTLAVLMYHYFYDKSKGEKGKNNNWMEISKFEEQLKYLKDNEYYFPTWDEVEDFVNRKVDLPKKSVVITMDDGQESLYDLAIPILKKYNIPATAFIITKNFDTDNIEKYKDSTIDFESHTNNMHRGGGNIGHGGIFTALPVSESIKDLQTSIEKLSGNNNALAYPYGDHNENTKNAAKQAGFKVAFTTENKKIRPGMDQYALPRVRMYAEITLKGFINSL